MKACSSIVRFYATVKPQSGTHIEQVYTMREVRGEIGTGPYNSFISCYNLLVNTENNLIL